jgi:membrane peptidoglycan carboxypeptidase
MSYLPMFKRKTIIIGLSIFAVCGVLIFAADLNRDMRQKLENIRRASSVYDREGRLVGNLYFYNRIWTSFDRIPKHVKNAVIAIEDGPGFCA